MVYGSLIPCPTPVDCRVQPPLYMYTNGLSLLEQKRIQWAREREEMVGLCGIWGSQEKPSKEVAAPTTLRRNSLLPPIQGKVDEIKAEESETSGYISDSPQHDSDSPSEVQQWSASRRTENYWADRKAQKNLRNESRLRQTPDSLLSTPEDRMKWGDRGVGVGHLWEPVVELPESRLPQVFESYRATPKWVERGLKLADGNKADILFIQDDDEQSQSKFLLGQNVPLPPDILEEREKKRQKALEHQNAIIKQLEDRDRKRKEEKENRLREERIEEERIINEQALERRRVEEEFKKNQEKEKLEKKKEEAMKDAIQSAENKAREEKRKLKKQELERVNEKLEIRKSKEVKRVVKDVVDEVKPRALKDSFCQAEVELKVPRVMTDSSSQSDNISGLEFMNVSGDSGLALVLDGVPDAVQLALLMPQGTTSDCHTISASKLRGVRVLADATTQTRGSCCSVNGSSIRSRRSQRQSSRASGRSDSSDKSTSLERRHTISHSHCCSSKQRSRSQPRLLMGERPKWGINRPAVQYLKQSEKDPHYMKKLKKKGRKCRGNGDGQIHEKMLESEFRLLAYQTDEENERVTEKNSTRKVDFLDDEKIRDVLANGFRMLSNPSSPRFIPLGKVLNVKESEETILVVEENDLKAYEDEEAKCLEEELKLLDQEVCTSPGSSTSQEVTEPSNLSCSNFLTLDNGTKTSGFETDIFPVSSNVTEISSSLSSDESNSPRSLTGSSNIDDKQFLNNQSSLPSPDEVFSPPSSGRSEVKSSADEGDCDESGEEGLKPESSPILTTTQKELLSQITALRLGLKRLENAAESRCSTPLSVFSLPDDVE